MHTTEVTTPQFQSALKNFAKYLVDLSKLTTFDSVSKAEEKAHERLGVSFEQMDAKELHIVMQFQQLTEIYARDRQMQLTGRNPYEIITEIDEAATRNGHNF